MEPYDQPTRQLLVQERIEQLTRDYPVGQTSSGRRRWSLFNVRPLLHFVARRAGSDRHARGSIRVES